MCRCLPALSGKLERQIHGVVGRSHGDSAAAGIFKSAARELAKIVKGVYRNGNFDIPVYVSYSGGVFKAMKL